MSETTAADRERAQQTARTYFGLLSLAPNALIEHIAQAIAAAREEGRQEGERAAVALNERFNRLVAKVEALVDTASAYCHAADLLRAAVAPAQPAESEPL